MRFFLQEENFLLVFFSREEIFFQEILLYRQIKPGNGDSFSFRKFSFDLVKRPERMDIDE